MPKKKKKKDRVFLVTLKLVYNESDLKTAIKWSNKHKYTYVRDEEFAPLLFAAEVAGIIKSDIDEAYIDEY